MCRFCLRPTIHACRQAIALSKHIEESFTDPNTDTFEPLEAAFRVAFDVGAEPTNGDVFESLPTVFDVETIDLRGYA